MGIKIENAGQIMRDNLNNVVDLGLINSLLEKTEDIGPNEKRIERCVPIPLLKRATYYQGKVRANFFGGNLFTKDGTPLRVIIATDQISTHDMVRGTIPFKGVMLTGISNRMLEYISYDIPSSQLATPGPVVVISENCTPIDFEMVLRKYMAKSTTETSLYHHYVELGERKFCGHRLPEGLVANGPLPYIIDTPSTKVRDAEGGHDVSVSPEYLVGQKIITPGEYIRIRNVTVEDYKRASARLEELGIIIADTKFELGRRRDGRIVYIDEVFTPDSSRFWLAGDYEEKMAAGQEPTSFSKQMGRDIGIPGQPYTNEERIAIGIRYLETYELLMGKPFEPPFGDARLALIDNINKGLDKLVA